MTIEQATQDFLPRRGGYRNLRCFQIATVIYALTYRFCERFLHKGDRTIDQMVQAARSGKQNIAEGSAASSTSKETEIKLTNVAKASLQELLLDYEDYLLTRGLRQWSKDEVAAVQNRKVAATCNDPQFYLTKSEKWDAATFANVVITLINQCDALLGRLIESQKRQFLQNGGIREEMSRARREYRASQTSQTSQTGPTSPTDNDKNSAL